MRVTRSEWALREHFMMTFICAGVAIATYTALLYTAETRTQCIPRLCEESSGLSNSQDSITPDTPIPGFSTSPLSTPSGPFDASTWEVRTSTDQRDASWIPPLAE